MKEFILIGADVHDSKIVMQYAVGKSEPKAIACENTAAGRAAFIKKVLELADGDAFRVRVMYESGPHWFTFHDDWAAVGVRCTILPAHHLDRSVHARANKTDCKDAARLLRRLRNELLAGDKAPAVWVPDMKTRGDRELVNRRMSIGKRVGQIKTQINSLLRKYGVELDFDGSTRWTLGYRTALEEACKSQLPAASAEAAYSMLRELKWMEQERKAFDEKLSRMASTNRYWPAFAEMTKVPGVGQLTALAVLVTLGDPYRFKNRRKIASFAGLAPRTREISDY